MTYKISILDSQSIENLKKDKSWIPVPVAPTYVFSQQKMDVANPEFLKNLLSWESIEDVEEVAIIPTDISALTVLELDREVVKREKRKGPPSYSFGFVKAYEKSTGDLYRVFVKAKRMKSKQTTS